MSTLLSFLIGLVATLCVTQGAGNDSPPVERPQEPVMVVKSGTKGSWAPDGQRVAYRIGNGEAIEILDLTRLTRVTLVDAGKDPAWSPDGRHIVFVRGTNSPKSGWEELWLIQPDGTGLRRLGDGGYPSWSQDSRRIYAISRGDQNVVSIDVETGAVKTLCNLKESFYPAVSPDGRYIAYGSRGSFVVRELESNQVVQTVPTGRLNGLLPSWSPDGNWVGFGGYDNLNVGGLSILEVSTGRRAVVWEGLATLPAWTADGMRMSFDQRGVGNISIWIVGRSWIEGRLSGSIELPTKKPLPVKQKLNQSTNATSVALKLPTAGQTNTTSLLKTPAPDFTLNTLEGSEVSLASLKGSVVVLDFWASWCAPCRRSLPHLQALANRLDWNKRGLKVFGLNYEEREVATKFMKDNGYTFSVPMDSKGEVGTRYLVQGIPTTVVINREGVIAHVFIGFSNATAESLDKAIETALDHP